MSLRRFVPRWRMANRVASAPHDFFSDVEHLAEVAAETANQLDRRGLHDLARPLTLALERLARR